MVIQELIDQDAVRVTREASEAREKRAMIPASRFAWYEKEFREIAKHYDTPETRAMEHRFWVLWETFTGKRK